MIKIQRVTEKAHDIGSNGHGHDASYRIVVGYNIVHTDDTGYDSVLAMVDLDDLITLGEVINEEVGTVPDGREWESLHQPSSTEES